MPEEKKSKVWVYIESSLAGGVRAMVSMPFEHPFDCVKTKMQSDFLKYNSPFEFAKRIYAKEGVLGFYSGYIPNVTRYIIKNMYRIPLVILFNDIYSSIISSSAINKASVGLTVATLESVIVCPLERLKVIFMTKTHALRLREAIFMGSSLRTHLFSGLSTVFYRQIVSWVTYLVSEDVIRKEYRRVLKRADSESLSFADLMAISAMVGLVNSLSIYPIDLVKTLKQQHNNEMYRDSSFLRVAGNIYRSSGVFGLYRGLSVRLAHYMINSFFTSGLLDHFERKVKELRK